MASSDPGLNLTLGPIILAVIINTFLYGIVFTQGVTYYTSSGCKRDSWIVKCLVSWVLLLDTFHSCAVVTVVWEYCITHFGDHAFLEKTTWPYPTTPIFSACASVPIQIFLAWRVQILSKSWFIFGVLSTLAVTSGIMALISAIKAMEASKISDFVKLLPVVDAWLGLALFCDLALTTLLFLYLHRSRTGFAKTDNLITRITMQSIETASIGTINSILNLISFAALQTTNLNFVFALISGRFYTNTLLTTLNSRTKLSEFDGEAINTLPKSIRGTEVHISVARQHDQSGIAMENYPPRKTSAGIESSDEVKW
ncbi:hypothetical protein MVEN_00671200 [Mycena venus]|uniref:DUF6534 domain-containing protein n=1 Tax=Mycena venus TaxID=2733690 RepID=A0A8H6YRU1_9AGAR|nr:hypothetical protein MVEN_00671200 [Mycena venus]